MATTVKTLGKQTIYSLFYNLNGTQPLSGTFTPGKGWMLIQLSGSAYSNAGGSIGMNLVFNGIPIAECKAYTNESLSHKAFVPVSCLYKNNDIDEVNYQIALKSNTQIDQNDYFNLTVTVFEN